MQRDLDRLDAGEGKAARHDALREDFDEVDGLTRQLRVHGLGHLRVVDGVGEIVASGSTTRIHGDDDIGDEGLSVEALGLEHPVVAARLKRIKDKGGDPFKEYSLPEAVLKFRQGFGRLIRSQTDEGIVVVLDSRLLTKWYGRVFLRSLPECPVDTFEL